MAELPLKIGGGGERTADARAAGGAGGRFLVLTELLLPTKGGTAVWFDEVYRRLGGKSTHILTAAVPGDRDFDRGHPNTVHRLPLRDSAWLRPASLPRYLRLLARGLRLGLTHDFDSIHAGRVLPEGAVGCLLARLLRRPLVIYAHGEEITTWRRSPRRLRAMRLAYRRADIVIANSAYTRGELVALGVDPARIEIIHPGVDVERFRPGWETADLRRQLDLGEGARLVLSVGRLSPRKGFDQVIAALPHLLGEGLDVHYAVIGVGDDRERLLRAAHEHGVAERVHLLGHVEPGDLPRWYCAADVFAMPNRDIGGDTEGFGMVFIEAAACGTPSVGGVAGGTGAAIEEGVTGLRVDGDRVEAVAAALARLLADRELARELGSNGARRARQAFSWTVVAERTAALDTAKRGARTTPRAAGR